MPARARIEDPLALLTPVFEARGWSPFPFQRETWEAYLAGHSGLLHAPTGLGKTLAAYLGPVAEALVAQDPAAPPGPTPSFVLRSRPAGRVLLPPLRRQASHPTL